MRASTLYNFLVVSWSAKVVVVSAWTPITTLGRSISRSSSSSLQLSASSTNTGFDTSFMWNSGLSYGKGQFKFYDGFEKWMSVFPQEDRINYPEIFTYPKGTYEIKLKKPLGIVFEEIESGGGGVYVKDLVPGGNAAQSQQIRVGDVLVGITAVKVVGAKYERRLIPARKFDFDTMLGALASNEPRFSCDDVILAFERPDIANSNEVDTFMSFFEPPFDNPWKQPQ